MQAGRGRPRAVGAGDLPDAVTLDPEPEGYFSATLTSAGAGARYHFRLDGGEPEPDPASRLQPEGPEGPSEVIDPRPFAWTDRS